MDTRHGHRQRTPQTQSETPAVGLTRETLEVELPSEGHPQRLHVLHLLNGWQVGLIFVIEQDEVVLGRGETCALPLGDPGVSRAHCSLVRSVIGIQVTDLGSRNGTFLNGHGVTATTLLRHGDTLAIGGVNLRYGQEAEDQVKRLRALHDAAVRDHLTSLYNRRFLEERLLAEVAYAVRHGAPLSLLMLDIDHFKQLNDRYGHQAGDAALRAVAQTLTRGVRTEDMVARYGGEEFVVVARGAGLEGAAALAERLRARVQSLSLVYEGRTMSVTVSAGAAALTAGVIDPRSLVREADRALFEAKEMGRNRVVAARGDRTTERPAVVATAADADDEL